MDCCRVSRWWILKVLIGLVLVGQVVVRGFWPRSVELLTPISLGVGQAIVFSGALLVAGHYALLKRGNPRLSRPDELLTRGGLFPLVRHPMYLGDLIVILGLAALCPSVLSVTGVAVAVIALILLARDEDREMQQYFGETFAEYRKRSRHLFPFIY